MATSICVFCRGRNGEHKPGCSAPDNVKPIPQARVLRLMNNTPHALGMRRTKDPGVYEVVCIHTVAPDFVRGPVELMELRIADLGKENDHGDHAST